MGRGEPDRARRQLRLAVVEGVAGDPRFRDPVVVWPPAQASPSGAAFTRARSTSPLRGARLWA
ncbi:hypothetical protein V2I01_23075 [Micromonospora sp. BRA006-A]|nr:hypothetical protein [Micromonospora sp. BRA006-A]